MKKFDIEKAKNGAAVCLRDGTPVKILDFDYQGNILYKYSYEDPNGERIDDLGWVEKTGSGLDAHRENIKDKDKDLFIAPTYGFMNVFKNEDNKVLVGGVIRATQEDCVEAGKTDLMPGTKWFCMARVELLDEGEGGNGHDFFV